MRGVHSLVAEGLHMVKYDTPELHPPRSPNDWKQKYVVIGGPLASNHSDMLMFRSQKEYHVALEEIELDRKISVKVKEFSLKETRIQKDWDGPQTVNYVKCLKPWRFIALRMVNGKNSIKISSPKFSELEPIHEGIRKVIANQERYKLY